MSHSQTPETKPGPANPDAEGLEVGTPPGGPLRQDAPAPEVSGGHHDAVSGSETANRDAAESGGGTIPLEDEQPDPPRRAEHDLQEENAETSLDQPSEG